MDLLNYLINLDKELLLWLNGFNSPFFDNFMILITGRAIWIPFYLIIAGFIFFKHRERWWLILVIIGISIIAADLFASAFLKPFIGRPRPCHEDSLSLLLNSPNGCGGKFGFISSHAANTFALSTFLWHLFRKTYKWIVLIFLWAAVVSYSRIYLGVHYPGDILAGMLAGGFWATLFYNFYTQLDRKLSNRSEQI